MRAILLILFLWAAGSVAAGAQPRVTASIKPLQLIAKAVTDGISEPEVILDGSQDPHHPALRPSQRRTIAEADIVLWIGPEMETGLERVLTGRDARVLTLSRAPGIVIHRTNDEVDPHLWLDTGNAAAIARLLAEELVELDPGNEGQYRNNLEAFETALETLNRQIRGILDAPALPPFVVYHDSLQYFEKQFGLAHLASFTGNEEVRPGIKTILAIKSILAANNVNCIIVNPSVNTAYLDNLVGREPMRYVVVDVLAHDIEATGDGYPRFLTGLAEAIGSCRGNKKIQ